MGTCARAYANVVYIILDDPALCLPPPSYFTCNGTAKCLRCACVRNGTPCSYCLPGEAGNCHTLSSGHLSSTTRPPSASSVQSVTEDPGGGSRCSRLFMLTKCVLASPPAGHRLRWHEIQGLVKSRIQRWVGGDLVTLWSEAVEGAQSLSKRSRSAPQRSINIRRAKMATQEGQYSKAIRALTSDGLATPSATVLQEMLTKHPQSASASCPPARCLPRSLCLSQLSAKVSGPSPTARPLARLAYVPATSGKLLDAPPLTSLTNYWPPLQGSSTAWLLAELQPP